MDEGKIKVLENVLTAHRLIDRAKDIKLITHEDFNKYVKSLNDKTHSAIDDLLA